MDPALRADPLHHTVLADHPGLTDAQIELIVRFLLSLDGAPVDAEITGTLTEFPQ